MSFPLFLLYTSPSLSLSRLPLLRIISLGTQTHRAKVGGRGAPCGDTMLIKTLPSINGCKIGISHNVSKQVGLNVQRSAKSRGCLLSYSQAEPGRQLTQPSPTLLAEPCKLNGWTISALHSYAESWTKNCFNWGLILNRSKAEESREKGGWGTNAKQETFYKCLCWNAVHRDDCGLIDCSENRCHKCTGLIGIHVNTIGERKRRRYDGQMLTAVEMKEQVCAMGFM